MISRQKVLCQGSSFPRIKIFRSQPKHHSAPKKSQWETPCQMRSFTGQSGSGGNGCNITGNKIARKTTITNPINQRHNRVHRSKNVPFISPSSGASRGSELGGSSATLRRPFIFFFLFASLREDSAQLKQPPSRQSRCQPAPRMDNHNILGNLPSGVSLEKINRIGACDLLSIFTHSSNHRWLCKLFTPAHSTQQKSNDETYNSQCGAYTSPPFTHSERRLNPKTLGVNLKPTPSNHRDSLTTGGYA